MAQSWLAARREYALRVLCHLPALISRRVWGVIDVADEGFELRRGRVASRGVSDAAAHLPLSLHHFRLLAIGSSLRR